MDCFLQELAGSLEEEDRNRSSPEPQVVDYERWVIWQAWAHNMPDWWLELAKIPGVDADLPTQGQPCLLAGSILEMREAMECHVSFPDDAIFSGMALPEES